jgi:hypothetical protein
MIFALELQEPANVKALVAFMHRRLGERPGGQTFHVTPVSMTRTEADEPDRLWRQRVPFLWNGDVPGGNCLVKPELDGCPEQLKDRDFSRLEPFGADSGCGPVSGAAAKRQTGGDACPLVFFPSPQGPQVGPGGSITFIPGPPSPTCTAGCGTLCTGYFCRPDPSGKPADQWDPNDPRRPGDVETDPNPTLPPLPGTGSCTASEVPTTTTVCKGSGNQQACGVETICAVPDPDPTPPPLPGPGTCTAPEVSTTTTVCNGSGNQEACGVQTVCVLPDPGPTPPPLPPAVTCTAPEVVTTATTCNRGSCALTTLCVTSRPTPAPTPEPQPEPPKPKEFLAVQFSQLHLLTPGPFGGCSERARFYSIKSYGDSHQTGTTYCKPRDVEHMAGSATDRGQALFGDYDDGWHVAQTGYGGNVHNGKGQHQRCITDRLTIDLCTLSCGDYIQRSLKCEGVWHND